MAISRLKNYLCSLCDAVRERAGTTCSYCASDLPNVIRNLVADPPYPAGTYIVSTTTNSDGNLKNEEVIVWGVALSNQFNGDNYIKTIHVNEGITHLPYYFAKEAEKLQTVYIPSGIETMDTYVFNGCTALSRIIDSDGRVNTFPEKITTVPNYTFGSCKALGTFVLHDNITTIGTKAFYAANIKIENLPGNLQVIKSEALRSCSCTFTEIPAPVQTIESNAFYGNATLTQITFKGTPNSIATNAFSNCSNITTINCPWAEGAVANAPWGATNATINYDYES